jgi:hypothetical protein
MKKYIAKLMIVSSLILMYSGCATSYSNISELKKVTHIKNKCVQPDDTKSAWYIGNLYDCKTNSFFIPYQLWSGAKYDGNKANSKKHQVDNISYSTYNSSGKLRPILITGTTKFTNEETGEVNNIYKRVVESKRFRKVQYFIASDMGIGRVYDNRKGGRYFSGSGIKFPAGYGWSLNKKRKAYDTINGNERITEIEINKMEFTKDKELKSITFKWWVNGRLDRMYEYTVNNGLSKAIKL